VASLFQVLTYPVEVFLLYAGSFDPAQAARACLVLLAVGAAMSVPLARLLAVAAPELSAGMARIEWPLSRRTRLVAIALPAALLGGSIVLPVSGLVLGIGNPSEALHTIRAAAPAIAGSLAIAGIAAALCPVLAFAASGLVARRAGALRRTCAVLLLLPLCVPSSAFAIAWAELRTHSLAGWPLPGILEPALCLTARWAGPMALLLGAGRLALPRGLMDAARLQEASPFRRFLSVEAPLLAPLVLIASALVGADSFAATGVLVLTVPPGAEVLPLRIDNLLHYGERGSAAVLALVQGALVVGLLLGLVGIAHALGRRSR
jgi:ABC-type Fe3+ transport system permease subunit